MIKPKILIYDIETSPCKGWFWRTGKQVINANQILEFGKIICISYRFTHWPEGQVKNLSWNKHQNDAKMCMDFYKIADRADVLVGHNGDNFDKKWLNTRLAFHGHPTLIHQTTEDTLKQARQQFNLPSFRLGFLCKYFGIEEKLVTKTGLWDRVVFQNNRESLKDMMEYCDQDVLILDKLYKRIWPYIKHKINIGIFNDVKNICPKCGSKHRRNKGYRYTSVGKYQDWLCKNCNHRYRDGKNLIQNSSEIGR